MNPYKNNKIDGQFLKIPREKWKYDLGSGQITDEELDILLRLWLKANPTTGKVAINYSIFAEEIKGRFPYIKKEVLVNKLTKTMNSLKRKQRLWFKEHSGSKKPVEVEIAEYPLIQGGYADISYHFQQNFSRGNEETVFQNTDSPAELLKDEQRLKELKGGVSKLKSSMSMDSPSRAPKIDRKIIERKSDLNTSVSPEERPLEKLRKNLKDMGILKRE